MKEIGFPTCFHSPNRRQRLGVAADGGAELGRGWIPGVAPAGGVEGGGVGGQDGARKVLLRVVFVEDVRLRGKHLVQGQDLWEGEAQVSLDHFRGIIRMQ